MWDLFRELSFWFLMASPMMAGFKKNSPGCKCCGGVPCDQCSDGSLSNSYQLDISGVANGTCATCTDVNGTWIVDIPGGGISVATTCRISTLLGVTGCGLPFGFTADYIAFQVVNTAGAYTFEVVATDFPDVFGSLSISLFTESKGSSAPTCQGLSSESIPPAVDPRCNPSGGTCLVTSL